MSLSLDIQSLLAGYRSGTFTPEEIIERVLERADAYHELDPAVWIHRLEREELLGYARALGNKSIDDLPLYGIPFAIKDNIDLAGHPTTAACPDFTYIPEQNAHVVQRLIDAGAIPIGKTNLDQFATGLVGTRSPYGMPGCVFDRDYVSGGSSSGSSVAVAAGLVSFSLGTDTAGSGRVPAMINNLVGLKPTRGLLSNAGVVPACKSLDCVSIFALTSADAGAVLRSAQGYDEADTFSRPRSAGPARFPDGNGAFRFGLPDKAHLEFFGDTETEALFDASVQRLIDLGGEAVPMDLGPFLETARLLYEGPWVTERRLAVGDFADNNPDALHPVTRQIVMGADGYTARDSFNAYYRLKELKRQTQGLWRDIDLFVTPTAGTHYTKADLQAEPIKYNSNLGYYTNFVNLLDLSAVAAPAGFTSKGLAFGVTFIAPPWAEASMLSLSDAFHRTADLPMGGTNIVLPSESASTVKDDDFIEIAVVGAHLNGLPLNGELTGRGARFVCATETASQYQLFALGGTPERPGMVRATDGAAIKVEVWALPKAQCGGFLAGIPYPLGLGSLELADGSWVKGFMCEAEATKSAQDITTFGGWRAYQDSKI